MLGKAVSLTMWSWIIGLMPVGTPAVSRTRVVADWKMVRTGQVFFPGPSGAFFVI